MKLSRILIALAFLLPFSVSAEVEVFFNNDYTGPIRTSTKTNTVRQGQVVGPFPRDVQINSVAYRINNFTRVDNNNTYVLEMWEVSSNPCAGGGFTFVKGYTVTENMSTLVGVSLPYWKSYDLTSLGIKLPAGRRFMFSVGLYAGGGNPVIGLNSGAQDLYNGMCNVVSVSGVWSVQSQNELTFAVSYDSVDHISITSPADGATNIDL